MRILSLDFETTWTAPVNPKICRIREIGAVLFDWENKRPLKLYSEFIHDEDHPMSPKELVDLTGITDEMVKEFGIPLTKGLHELRNMFSLSDFIIAHNGNGFDKPLLLAECDRKLTYLPERPWIDSKMDIDYPPHMKSHKLTHLCGEHGFLNPFSHRAIFDALAVLKILTQYPIEPIIESAKQPNCKVVANVSFQERDKAKLRGYYWDGENKYWWKELKLHKAEKEKQEAPFPVQIREQSC